MSVKEVRYCDICGANNACGGIVAYSGETAVVMVDVCSKVCADKALEKVFDKKEAA